MLIKILRIKTDFLLCFKKISSCYLIQLRKLFMIFKMHKKEVIKRVSVLAITKVITFRLKKVQILPTLTIKVLKSN